MANAKLTRDWVKKSGLELFPKSGYESVGLTCVKNTRKIDVPKMIEVLKRKYSCIIDGGYGRIKGATFRISHMGDESTANIKQLLGWLDDCISEAKA